MRLAQLRFSQLPRAATRESDALGALIICKVAFFLSRSLLFLDCRRGQSPMKGRVTIERNTQSDYTAYVLSLSRLAPALLINAFLRLWPFFPSPAYIFVSPFLLDRCIARGSVCTIPSLGDKMRANSLSRLIEYRAIGIFSLDNVSACSEAILKCEHRVFI